MNESELKEKKYVAFIDVLGFKELVFNESHFDLITYFDTINKTLDKITRTKNNVKTLLFSDCIVLSTKDTEDDFKFLLQAIQTIQADLILKNIIFRGAVSFGELYFNENDNILVGKGLISAYELEKSAIYPRVIIDPIIFKKVAQDRQDFLNKFSTKYNRVEGRIYYPEANVNIKLPNDETFFIDYLDKIFLMQNLKENLETIFNFLKNNIYKFQNQEKYLWLKKYFSLKYHQHIPLTALNRDFWLSLRNL